MKAICEVIKGMEEAIIIEETVIEIKIMIGIGVGHAWYCRESLQLDCT